VRNVDWRDGLTRPVRVQTLGTDQRQTPTIGPTSLVFHSGPLLNNSNLVGEKVRKMAGRDTGTIGIWKKSPVDFMGEYIVG